MPTKKAKRKLPASPKQRFIRPRKGFRITSARKVTGGVLVTEVRPKFPRKKKRSK